MPDQRAVGIMPRVVVLHFASGSRVDLVDGTEQEAIADFTARALRAGAELPLLSATTALVPVDKLRAFLGEALPTTPATARPSLSVAGVCRAVRLYMEAVGASREPEALDKARADLGFFFDLYGVDLDFRVAPTREKKTG